MKFNTFGIASASLVGILGMLWASSNANAQVTGVVSANGQIYFSSDSDTYNYASPSVVTNPGTGLTTVNANNALNGLPGAPAAGNPNPFTVANSFPFVSPYPYVQVDPLPAAQRTVAGVTTSATISPPLVADVTAPHIQAYPFTGLHQTPGAPGYALEQFDFDAFYSVGSLGVLSATKTITASINGNLTASGANPNPFAEFGYTINYYEVDATTTLLGSADAYGSWLGAGPVVATVNGPSSLISGFPYSTYLNIYTGVIEPVQLEITGTMFMAGDPASFDVSVENVPEPTSLGLLATAAVLLCRRRRRSVI